METIIFEINPTVRTPIQDEGNCSPPSRPVRKSDWTKVLGGENQESRFLKKEILLSQNGLLHLDLKSFAR